MCYRTKTSAKDFTYQWEWSANPNQWIPYDIPSAQEIETSYQAKNDSCTLSQGFFRDFPGVYVVKFNHNGRKFVQINQSSSNRRRVRRISDDDNSIMEPVSIDFDNVICVVCQEPFESSTDKTKEVVKLPPCEGHYFHRGCIAPCIKLKDECPICKKKIVY
jgi:hypothetical protein